MKSFIAAAIVLFSSHEKYELRKYTLDEMSAMTADKLEQHEDVKLTEEQLQLKREGLECLGCDPYASDPNMRPEAFKNF